MKKIVGMILLVLALISAVNLVVKLSRAGDSPQPRNAAYESGRKAGRFFAPVLLGGLGLWLVLTSGQRRRTPPPIGSGGSNFVPAKPWYKTAPAIIGFSVVGGAVGLVILMVVLGAVSRFIRRSPRTTAPPPPGRSTMPGGAGIAQTGPFTLGGSVEANWGGKWTVGKITAINPGGFTVMVQLEDARFPHPIVLSTNQIRLR
jgi:hypothetical protein